MIYADYNGSAPLLPSVREHLKRRLDSEIFANPNAIHSLGQKISSGLEKCRSTIAQVMGCFPDQLLYNSGASEGVSHVLYSVLEFAPAGKRVIITSRLEHVAVLKALAFYENQRGFQIKFVENDIDGRIRLDLFKNLIDIHEKEVALVTIMAANNETGVIQPFREIAKLCSDKKVEFFCDTTQYIGKDEFQFAETGIDYAVCSGHKLGALSGSGFIIAKDPIKLSSMVFGSSQERGLRGGTQNYLGVETLAVALLDFQENKHKLLNLKEARLAFEASMKKDFPNSVIIGEGADRLPGTTLIGYPGLHGQAVQIELESHDIFVTTSAACADNQPETSAVLRAMGVNDEIGRSVIRISLSYSHGEKEYSEIARILKSTYTKLGKIHSY
jgi:cysteine desulfurase